MSSSIARKVGGFFRQAPLSSPEAALLTPRENEILDLLAQGFRNKEIAEKLRQRKHDPYTSITSTKSCTCRTGSKR